MILKRKLLGLRYEQYWFDGPAYLASSADVAALRTHGEIQGVTGEWTPAFSGPCQCRIPEFTLVVSLTPAEDEIVAGFEARARASIRNAQRTVKVTWASTPEERQEFYRGYSAFAAGRGLLIPDAREEEDLDLLFARDAGGDLIQAAAFLQARGPGIYRYRYGFSVKKTQANAGILFEAMRRAKANGFTRFDLGGVTPGAKPGSAAAGINFFKSQFGGAEVRGHLCLRGRTPLLRMALRILQAGVPMAPALKAVAGFASHFANRITGH